MSAQILQSARSWNAACTCSSVQRSRACVFHVDFLCIACRFFHI